MLLLADPIKHHKLVMRSCHTLLYVIDVHVKVAGYFCYWWTIAFNWLGSRQVMNRYLLRSFWYCGLVLPVNKFDSFLKAAVESDYSIFGAWHIHCCLISRVECRPFYLQHLPLKLALAHFFLNSEEGSPLTCCAFLIFFVFLMSNVEFKLVFS